MCQGGQRIGYVGMDGVDGRADYWRPWVVEKGRNRRSEALALSIQKSDGRDGGVDLDPAMAALTARQVSTRASLAPDSSSRHLLRHCCCDCYNSGRQGRVLSETSWLPVLRLSGEAKNHCHFCARLDPDSKRHCQQPWLRGIRLQAQGLPGPRPTPLSRLPLIKRLPQRDRCPDSSGLGRLAKLRYPFDASSA
ncbi:hypothetical protein BKA80DRAFT_74568 [Phyllosticta citrichinensis]